MLLLLRSSSSSSSMGWEGREWRQYQFQKRIGWRAPSVIPEGRGKVNHDGDRLLPYNASDNGELARSYSTSAIDDIKAADAAEFKAVTEVNEKIAHEINAIREASGLEEDPRPATSSEISRDLPQITPDDSISPTTTTSQSLDTLSDKLSSPSTSLTEFTPTASKRDGDAQGFLQHIVRLRESRDYGQIPAVFASMLSHAVVPTTSAYNALLEAAIYLPTAKHQVVPKALDVYADMLRRKVSPDTAFYNTLVQLLSRRALEVFHAKESLMQKQLRYNGVENGKQFLFASSEAEFAILAEDDAFTNAIKVFQSASTCKGRTFPAETYGILITACALNDSIEAMIQVFNHMESHKVTPIASIFAPMIEALAKTGDLSSVVDVYNGYKSLAIANDVGTRSFIDRKDTEVYAALVKAYARLGKADGGNRFIDRIIESYASVTEHRKQRLDAVQDRVVVDGLVEERLAVKDFATALRIAEERDLSPEARSQAMARVCMMAADNGNAEIASRAHERLSPTAAETQAAALSLFALHIRLGDLDAAGIRWKALSAASTLDMSFVEPVTLYGIGLIKSGRIDEGLLHIRNVFGCIRTSVQSQRTRNELSEQVDEAIELITTLLANERNRPSPNGRMSILWTMVENGSIMSHSAEELLAGLGPQDIENLSWQDISLVLQVEAELLANGEATLDIAHTSRFVHLVNITLDTGIPLDERSVKLIDRAMGKLSAAHPDTIQRWRSRQQSHIIKPLCPPPFSPMATPTLPLSPPYPDTLDPYAASTDFKGSTIIVEELDTRRNAASLNEALTRFKNIRRGGRHPRYIAYAKLIMAAAKEGRINLTHDILGMARSDLPYQSEFSDVRHGWVSILDAMVGACLLTGRRPLAEQFHQELLDVGAAPSANTYGLYITTLKESTKTFDEATEAVSIFNRALSEGVAPSSFLYNALIGKLGKARRIDDCLRYFQEMRSAGIRPTSVTYGTIVNALCRVSDERFAEELFDEMEAMPNYKPRPAPYNSLMQFYLNTKCDGTKVLALYERMRSKNIQPTMHTYKLLIDTHATLEPVNLIAAEGILNTIRASGQRPEAVHYASLIHAKGCALHDLQGAREVFDQALRAREFRPQACLYQALFESMVANHCVHQIEPILDSMSANHVEMTPYIANTLIHGWANKKQISKSKAIFDSVGLDKREPSTYESMTRAFLTVEERDNAMKIVREMLSRGYPAAVSNKVLELVGHGLHRGGNLTSINPTL